MSSAVYQQARLSRDRRFDGQFFVAVKSTGIFCRNICPAKLPKEENVEYYRCASQALVDGFRPCLRCRPDSAPQSYAWLGVDTTLMRAMTLLKSHPEMGLMEISDKLGISDGYLRKLFRQKLGISPKQFQLSEQLLFAKKLLHESELSIEQVAQSAGFQSSRRLQQNMKSMLQLTPSDIRKSQQKRAVSLKICLTYTPPYCWQQVRDFLNLRAITGMEKVTSTTYERNFVEQGKSGWFKAEIVPEHHRFNVEIRLSEFSILRTVIQNIRRVLDLDTDSYLIAQALKNTGLPASSITEGLRLPGIWSVFEAACRAVLGQQVSIKAAVNHVTHLTSELGTKTKLGPNTDLDMLFPEPETVAASELNFFRMPGARKQALRDVASLFAKESDVVDDDLLAIKGIGPWTVNYLNMRGKSNPDIWLNGDLVIKKQIEQYQLEPDKAAPWRSYLTFQLWNLAS